MAMLLRHTLTLLIFQKSTRALALCCSSALLLQGLSVTDSTQCINVMSAICKDTVILLQRLQLNKLNIVRSQRIRRGWRWSRQFPSGVGSHIGYSAVHNNSNSHLRPTRSMYGQNLLNTMYGLHGDMNSRSHVQDNENNTLTLVWACTDFVGCEAVKWQPCWLEEQQKTVT